jgi:lipopolysaccharide export system permease protein
VRIASRYILREFASASFAVLAALVVLWLAADTLVNLTKFDDDLMEQVRVILYRSLDVIPLGVPMACVVGAVWSLTRAVRFREITAIRCGGIPLRGVLVPILATCVVIGGLMALFEDRVIVPSRLALIAGETDEQPGIDALPWIQGRYWHTTPRAVFSAEGYNRDDNTLFGVTYFELDDAHLIQTRIQAARAVNVEGARWEFENAHIIRFGQPGQLSDERATTLVVDLGVTGTTFAWSAAPPEATTLRKLLRRVRESPLGDPDLPLFESGLHRRLAQPLAVVILVLLALPYAIGDVERGDSLPRALVMAMIASSAFWIAWMLATLASRTGVVPPAVPIWSVIALFLGAGAWRFRTINE